MNTVGMTIAGSRKLQRTAASTKQGLAGNFKPQLSYILVYFAFTEPTFIGYLVFMKLLLF
jgi:hypothetical protein